jgi:hypothetical protein
MINPQTVLLRQEADRGFGSHLLMKSPARSSVLRKAWCGELNTPIWLYKRRLDVKMRHVLTPKKHSRGAVRNAIISYLSQQPKGATIPDIQENVVTLIGSTPKSSIRSYLRLKTGTLFQRIDRGRYRLAVFKAHQKSKDANSLLRNGVNSGPSPR